MQLSSLCSLQASCIMIRMIRTSHFFFFSCPGDPRDLHSFPTRRSSISGGSGMRQINSPAARAAVVNSPASVSSRSEEHTSELQSRQYLVCRLLLEKKKSKKLSKLSRVSASECNPVQRT